MRGRSRTRALAGILLATGLVAALAACTPDELMPVPEVTVTPSPGATEPPPEPELVPDGSAADNLPYFNAVNRATAEQGGALGGRDFIDALVAAGFSKAAMEVTPDRTSINAGADQIQFSVRVNGECLIGQYGGERYNGIVAPLLSTGTCLIGTTRPIDW